jgi:tryprostatin B 6-hydroxylase
MDSIGATTTLPLLAGVLSHVFYFRIGEHHRRSASYAQVALVAPAIGTFAFAAFLSIPYFPAFVLSLQIETLYLSGLYASVLVYRAFFHRLHSFPGPLSWRLTKLTQAWTNRDLMNYKHLDALFRKYGEYVRTGKAFPHPLRWTLATDSALQAQKSS